MCVSVCMSQILGQPGDKNGWIWLEFYTVTCSLGEYLGVLYLFFGPGDEFSSSVMYVTDLRRV